MAGNDEYTKLLIHSNHADLSTTITDSSASGRTITRVGDPGVRHSTYYTPPFNASALFFGTSYHHLVIPASDDFVFGSGDFTVDFWTRSFDNTFKTFIDCQEWSVHLDGSNKIKLFNGDYTWSALSTATIGTGLFHHVAIVRSGNTITFYKNGTAGGSTTYTGSFSGSTSKDMVIGCLPGPSSSFNALATEIRISKGIARWTADFTPPTEQYEVPPFEVDGDGGAIAGGTADVVFPINITGEGGAVGGGAADIPYNYASIDGYVPLLYGEISAYVTNAAQVDGYVPRLYADISTTGASLDGFIPLLEAEITAQNTQLAEIDGYVPLLHADIDTLATWDCLVDGIVPLLYADVTAISGATCSLDGYVPRLYADIEALKTSGEVDGVVPELFADIRTGMDVTDDILSFQQRPGEEEEATHEMNIPLLHATITADAGEPFVLGFVRGER
jgi:hypothetical protein